MTVMNENLSEMCTVLCKTFPLNEDRPHSLRPLSIYEMQAGNLSLKHVPLFTHKSLQVADFLGNPQPTVSVFAFA
jgi:hypothetical protein